jgi:glucuronosyltransferase
MEELAKNEKHNLTILSPVMEKGAPNNMHYIHLEKMYETMFSGKNPINHLDRAKHSPMKFVIMTANVNLKACEGILMSEGLSIILNYPDDFKFDVVVYDFHYGPCLLSLLHKFKYPPLIGINAFHTPSIKRLALVGGHIYSSYVAFYAMSEGGHLNFWQRFYSSFLYAWEFFYRNYIFMPKLEQITRNRFEFKDMPTLDKLERQTRLVLLNQDYAIDFPEPLIPNVIQVGGLQIAEPKLLTEV